MNIPDIYDHVRDEALAGRLSAALGRAAATIAAPADAWVSLQTRLGETGSATPLFEAVGYAEAEMATGHDDVLSDAGATAVALPAASPSGPGWTAPPRTRSTRWRVPLIAAASVAVVAAGVAAASTGLFGAGGSTGTHAAAPTSSAAVAPAEAADRPVGDPVAMPISCAPDDADPCASSAGLTLQLTGDPTSSTVGLHATLSIADPDGYTAELGAETRSDGTPLGLLSAFGPAGDAATVFGAAQPDVAQLLVTLSARPLLAGTIRNPAYQTVPTQQWRFVSPANTWIVGLEGEVHDAPFTELAGGYHAFAVRVPIGLTEVDLTALDAGGHVLQDRSLNLDTGQISEPIAPDAQDEGGVLATMTVRVDPTRGVLAEIEASKRAEALHSLAESAEASMPAASAAAERERSLEAEARATAIVENVKTANARVQRAQQERDAAAAALASAEAAASAQAAADALTANASAQEQGSADLERERAETRVAAAQESLQRAQALLTQAEHLAWLATNEVQALGSGAAVTTGP